MYSNIDSLSDDDENIGMAGVNGGSLLGLAATISKAKCINTGAVFGSSLDFFNFDIDDDKEWIDLKIVKTQMEVSVKQSFALDINLSTVEGKLVMAKTQIIRKNFSTINGFGGATTPLKFEGIIQLTFTLEKSIEIAILLVRKKEIDVNSDLKRQGMRSDRTVVIKKISMNTPKDIIISAVFKFGKIKLIKIQLIGMDQFRVLLFTLLVETMAHDLGTLLERAGRKTCIINRSLKTGNRIYCAVVGFESDDDLKSAFCIEPILGRIKLSWARIDLVWCEKYESLVILLWNLAKLYKKKSVPIFCSAVFGGKSWALMVFTLLLVLVPLCLSLQLLTDQVSGIVCKLSSMKLVSLALSLSSGHSVVPIVVNVDLDLNMVLDGSVIVSATPPVVLALGFSSSKILTTKVDCLESKLVALEVSIGFVLVKLDQFGLVWKFVACNVCSINVLAKQMDVVHWHVNFGNMVFFIANKFKGVYVFISGLNKNFLDIRVVVIINNLLACHVSKIKKISDRIISVWLLFKGKLSVTILGLYAGVSFETRFGQALEVNFLIAEAVNSSTFVVLDRDFNENGSGKSATFKFCLGLGLINFNLWEVEKTIDFIFVSRNLSFTVTGHQVCFVSGFFDINYSIVSVSIGLGGLLDTGFRDCLFAKLLVVADEFLGAETHSDVDAMWIILERMFSEFDCFRNKFSSKFFGLELLVVKIVKKFVSSDLLRVDCLMKTWSTLNSAKAHVFADLVGLSEKIEVVLGHLSLVCKEYRRSKIYESRVAKEASIKLVISKCIENFCSDKDSMIRSVLDWPSCKVVLNYLVVDDKLILEPEKVKLNNCVFSNVMGVISLNKLLLVVNGLPNGKAAGLSGIFNEL
ncbi:hypothetical protein G9A89_001463 [Geosiphon pyriformis]|nr:hypothetical protein G9A89_001463 [Geosiphon pyriformis]